MAFNSLFLMFLVIQIVETKRFLENTERKYCSYDLIYHLLKSEKPVNVDIQKKNKFKLYYNHPNTDRILFSISNSYFKYE